MKVKYRNAHIMFISWEGEYKQSACSLRWCILFCESLEEKNPGVIQAICEVADLLFVRAKPASIWVLQASEAGRKVLCAAWSKCSCYCIYYYGIYNRFIVSAILYVPCASPAAQVL